MKILLATQPMPAAIFIDAIRARAPELELVEYRSALGDADLADVDVLLGWQMPRGLLARLPRLRWVCSVAAGVEKLLAPDLAPDVRVSRVSGSAQTTMSLAASSSCSVSAERRFQPRTTRPQRSSQTAISPPVAPVPRTPTRCRAIGSGLRVHARSRCCAS